MDEIDVLVVGAGPVGLTLGLELRRRGVGCRVVDRLPAPVPYAKAVGVQPRTLEIWESAGLLRDALDRSTPMTGQLVFVNGREIARMVLDLPPEVPFGFVALPQYETERMLTEHLAGLGTGVDRGVQLTSFTEDADVVVANLTRPGGEEQVRARYLVGCDGAHSAVRKGLGLTFGGDAFTEEYMLGDVELDWKLAPGFAIRSLHRTPDGRTDDVLVCIPLPGHGRYRVSMLAPPELVPATAGSDSVAHGFEGDRRPELHHIQAVLDRLAPQRATASNLRWSSVFRISHRIVDRYGGGRVFVAGDAAHIHPPTGAQGMNTGIQDAVNLGWKLALAVDGIAADGLLDSYDAERRPIGEEVVGRTVRHAQEGFEGDPDDPRTLVLREAQLLLGYRDSLLVDGDRVADAPAPGDRAPDVRGLRRPGVAFDVRLFELLGGPRHTLLLHAATADDAAGVDDLASAARGAAHGRIDTYAVLGPDADPGQLLTPAVRDVSGAFAATYQPERSAAFVVRPDGYLGYRGTVSGGPAELLAHMARTFRPPTA